MIDLNAPTEMTPTSANPDGACNCCCGSNDTAELATNTETDASTTSYGVDGMTCSHCVTAVTNALTALDGVTAVDVQLEPNGTSQVTVARGTPLTDEQVAGAIAEAGYALADSASSPR